MNYLIIFVASLFFIGLLTYLGFRIRRHGKLTGATNAGVDFQTHIGFTRQDGWVSLALMLDNRSEMKVWAEEVRVVLADLKANDQTAVASGKAIHPIRQTVGPEDMLPISLVEAIYEAAGKPQRRYSCFLSATVRYQADDRWFEKTMPAYKIKMAAFKVYSARPVRWYQKQFQQVDIPIQWQTPEQEEQSHSVPTNSGRPGD